MLIHDPICIDNNIRKYFLSKQNPDYTSRYSRQQCISEIFACNGMPFIPQRLECSNLRPLLGLISPFKKAAGCQRLQLRTNLLRWNRGGCCAGRQPQGYALSGAHGSCTASRPSHNARGCGNGQEPALHIKTVIT